MDNHYKDHYVALKREFEKQLHRSLNHKEKDFVLWLAKKVHLERENDTFSENPNRSISLGIYRR